MARSTTTRSNSCSTTLALVLLATPALAQVEVGENDFSISSTANLAGIRDAGEPAVAHNPNDGEYLVVWSATAAILASSGTAIIDRRVILAKLIDAETGAGTGGIELVSTSKTVGREARRPAVTYNSRENEFLVVWEEDDSFGLALGEKEIFGQILSSNLVPVGGNFRISDMGPESQDFRVGRAPDVAYNSVENEYLAVWWGSDSSTAGIEIYGQRLNENGSALGTNDFRISDAGTDDPTGHLALDPKVAFNSVENEYLVVWNGTDDVGGLEVGEYEVFGQRLNEVGTPQGTNDFRISDMGGTGDTDYGVVRTSVAFNPVENEYLVVWTGWDDEGGLLAGEAEIFGQRLDESGGHLGTNDFRISDVGGTGAVRYNASHPSLAYGRVDNQYVVAWRADDSFGGLVDDEFEIFVQRLDAVGQTLGSNDFRISDMGGTGDNPFDATDPAIAYSATENQVLVVWRADDDGSVRANEDFEIYGQRVDVAPIPLEVLLEVDLSVSEKMTISATSGDAAASVFGPDGIGVYLDSFFPDDAAGSFTYESGDLAPALNPSDGSPGIFRFDAGLNLYSLVDGLEFEFATGTLAFTGSATWSVDPELYSALSADIEPGLLYAPADSIDDLPTASLIGRWSVKGAGAIFADGFESGNTSAWQ